MAREFKPVIFSDLDTSKNPEPIPEDQVAEAELSYNGRSVHLDLTKDEEKELSDFLQKYLKAGRKVDAPKTRRSPATSGRRSEEVAAMRAWLKLRGRDVPERGRIRKDWEQEWIDAGRPGV